MTLERPMFPPLAESVDSFSPAVAIEQPPGERLTSDSPKPSEGPSRRNMLGSLAVMPAAFPVVAQAATDPIFEAIEVHRAASANQYSKSPAIRT
jgi:hypothetical protein